MKIMRSAFLFLLISCGFILAETGYAMSSDPREIRTTVSMNQGWKFVYGDSLYADDEKWIDVNVPHDFQIHQSWVMPSPDERPDDDNPMANIRSRLSSRGFKEMGAGWYRKSFVPDSAWLGRRELIDFEGILLVGDVYLNGKYIGGTDYGYLGYPWAIEKRIQLLKKFGFNHIRTSHNPYSKSFLDLCDEYGILVVDELYDKWLTNYAGGRREWIEQWQYDVPEWIRRDRNHPSVVIWSLGIEAVAYRKGEKSPVCRHRLETAGKAVRLDVEPDNMVWNGDGIDLQHVRVTAVDKNGHRDYGATHNIRFEVEGPAEIVGVINGDLTSDESTTGNERRLYNGTAVVILRSTTSPGEVRLKAIPEHSLPPVKLSLLSK